MCVNKRKFGPHVANCKIIGEEMYCESVNGEKEPVVVTDKKIIKRFLAKKIIVLVYLMKPRKNKKDNEGLV